MTEQFLATHDLTPRVLTLGSNGAIKQASRAGLGVSLQSRTAVSLELDAGLLSEVSLREELPERHWYLLRSGGGARPRGGGRLHGVRQAARGPSGRGGRRNQRREGTPLAQQHSIEGPHAPAGHRRAYDRPEERT